MTVVRLCEKEGSFGTLCFVISWMLIQRIVICLASSGVYGSPLRCSGETLAAELKEVSGDSCDVHDV